MRNFRSCLILLTVLFAQSLLVDSVKLSSDGGYEVLLALDENTPVPSIGINRYVENIKTSLNTFSRRLWLTTNHAFHLKSVDILVPTNWGLDSASSATTQSYRDADIRVSPGTVYPHAENLNRCGQPGNAIDLPDSFFTQGTSGPFGVHEKSLLNLWAMYRFGVHSEHGLVGDSKFPYSYWDSQREELAVTGCSDEPIKGKFVDLTDSDVKCNSAVSVSNKNCRFVPDPRGQNASSSLMHFHWVESVDQFCDSRNHNKHSSNLQNAHCDHKSVWEVIRETPDFLTVTEPRNGVPALKINLVKPTSTPLFYLLLDRGRIQGSFSIANMVPPLLAKFVSEDALKHKVASIGAYPGHDNHVVEELVQWSEIGNNTPAFHDSIGILLANGSLQRDFSRALVAVADEIKQKNHPNGAVVLMFKFGADVENFNAYLPESEVMNALNEAHMILNVIELNFPNHTGYSHLARIAQETRGSYTVLDNYGEVGNSVEWALLHTREMLLQTNFSDIRKDWKTIRKDSLLNTAMAIPLASDIKGTLQLFVSSPNGNLSSTNFTVTGFNSTSGAQPAPLSFRLRKTLDWNEEGSKYTYRLEIPEAELEGITQVTLRAACLANNCANSLLARGEFSGETNKVRISVQTSVENNQADLSSGRPVSIFAKVTKDGIPVDGAMVVASLKEISSSNVTLIQLYDDGNFVPDIQRLDGIYSAYFAPEQDGQYELTVTVQKNPTRIMDAPGSLEEGYFTQLLPIDQGDMGCGSANCDAEKLEGSFSQISDLSSAFSVIQTSEYIPNLTKILTLTMTDRPTLRQVTLTWEAPVIPGRQQTVSSYELRSAPLFELLVTNFDNQTLIPISPNYSPKPPTGIESVTIARPGSTTYYAIRSVYRERKSVPSNIVEVLIDPSQGTTTTTTLSPPTGDPISTTEDDTTGPTSTDSNTDDPPVSDPTGGPPKTTLPTTTPPDSTAHKATYSKVAISMTFIIVLLSLFL